MHTTSKQLHRTPHLRIYRLKEDTSLPAMFNPLINSTNQQLLKRTFVIKVATTDDFRNKWKPSRAMTLFVVNKDEWDTKEGCGKSMKNALHVQQYAKRHLLDWSDVEKRKNQVRSLSIVELRESEGIRQAVSWLVSQ